MRGNIDGERLAHQWYTRPVLFVEDDGKGTVCQVNRAGCEIILCEDPVRRDKARLFVSLTEEGIAELRREIVERSVSIRKSWWGYDVVQIDDPDGNELLFPLPNE